jgi:hypothetical protein
VTRGKHGVLAANRRDQGGYEAEIATYQAAIVKKQARIDELESELTDIKAVHAQRVRELNARLAEGVSTELEAALAQNASLKEDIGAMRSRRKEDDAKWDTMHTRLFAHAESQHGMKRIEAIEWIGELLGEKFMIAEDREIRASGGDDRRILALQHARGLR